MRVMNLKQAHAFLIAPAPDGLGMTVTMAWVRKMSEPDADGKRRLPFFKDGHGRTSKLITTDDALREHYRRQADAALRAVAA